MISRETQSKKWRFISSINIQIKHPKTLQFEMDSLKGYSVLMNHVFLESQHLNGYVLED